MCEWLICQHLRNDQWWFNTLAVDCCKVKKFQLNFLENILQYKNDIINQSDILIIAQIMRNILDDFSYEFGYINNEDVYDRVFSNFCIGK